MLTPDDTIALQSLLERAKANPYTLAALRCVVDGILPPAGDNEPYVAVVSKYRVVLTVEQLPSGWKQHLSLSLPDTLTPNRDDVNTILEHLDMSPLGAQDHMMYQEHVDRFGEVLHILEPCDV